MVLGILEQHGDAVLGGMVVQPVVADGSDQGCEQLVHAAGLELVCNVADNHNRAEVWLQLITVLLALNAGSDGLCVVVHILRAPHQVLDHVLSRAHQC